MYRNLISGSIVLLGCLLVTQALAVQFNHDEHLTYLEEGQTCPACHKPEASVIIPAKADCLECHEEDFYSVDIILRGYDMFGQGKFPGIKIRHSCTG